MMFFIAPALSPARAHVTLGWQDPEPGNCHRQRQLQNVICTTDRVFQHKCFAGEREEENVIKQDKGSPKHLLLLQA